MQKAFAVDALASSHPLSRKEEEVNKPSEISEMFNTISYNKVSFPLYARFLSIYQLLMNLELQLEQNIQKDA